MESLELPTRREQEVAREGKEVLERIAERHESLSEAIEIGIEGEADHVKIPVSALKHLNTIMDLMAQGKAISVNPVDAEITTQAAADLLNVSRPFVVKLLEDGKISFHKVGTHRRIRLMDLLVYKDRMEKEREEALTELTRISQDLDLDN